MNQVMLNGEYLSMETANELALLRKQNKEQKEKLSAIKEIEKQLSQYRVHLGLRSGKSNYLNLIKELYTILGINIENK